MSATFRRSRTCHLHSRPFPSTARPSTARALDTTEVHRVSTPRRRRRLPGVRRSTAASGRSCIVSARAALLAIAVGFYLAKNVLAARRRHAEDAGDRHWRSRRARAPTCKRQFKTIGVILIPLAVIVFVTSIGDREAGRQRRAERSAQAGTVAHRSRSSLGCVASGPHRLHRHDARHPRQRPHGCRGAAPTACRRR